MEQLLLEAMKTYAAVHHVPILLEPSTAVLQQAARDKRPSRALEVGTAIGYSSLLIAREMASGGQPISFLLKQGCRSILSLLRAMPVMSFLILLVILILCLLTLPRGSM